MSQSVEKREISGKLLLRLGGVERLVEEGRTPHFVPFKSYDVAVRSRGAGTPPILQMFIFIPPEGVQVGDTILGAPSVGFEFFSSEGESRGYADVVVVDRALGESLRGRVTAVLQHPEQSGT